MTYKHLLLALGLMSIALIVRILNLAPFLNLLASLAMVLVPGAVAAWTVMLGSTQTTRWRLRHSLSDDAGGEELDHLDEGLHFLVRNARIVVLETNRDGLFLEVPAAFASYTERLIPSILPGGRLSRQRATRVEGQTRPEEEETTLPKPTLGDRWPILERLPVASLPLPSFLARQLLSSTTTHLVALDHPLCEVLLWGLQTGRRMRIHLIQDITGQPIVAATANLQGNTHLPPGRWRQVPALPLKHHTFGTPLEGRVSDAIPRVRGPSVYSTQSRLLYLPPPIFYAPRSAHRVLGTGVDDAGHAASILTVPYETTVLSVNAGLGVLDRQARNDARHGRAMVVISPHRALLKELAERARDHVLVDVEDALSGGHIPIITYAEQRDSNTDLAMNTVLDFLAEQGLDQSRPQILEFARHMILAILEAARVEERDTSLLELYAIARGPNSLYGFLGPRTHYWQSAGIEYLVNLVRQMRDDMHDFQTMAMLDALRTTLNRIWQMRTLNHIVQQPFPNFKETLQRGGALMCVLNDRDFPENDRYLRAMFEMVALRAVQATDVPVSVHLHSPTVYSSSTSLDRWLSLAQSDRVSLLVDLNERAWLDEEGRELRENRLAEHLLNRVEVKLLFHCPEILAAHLAPYAGGWSLPCPLTELAEVPDDTALARLPDGNGRWFTATLKAIGGIS